PQHSDARVLDQLVYKWTHFKESLILTLGEKYSALEASGWEISDKDIQRDLKGLLGGEFETFCREESQNK
ncbi:MAG: glucuronate isomerase, partial [Verrucomicrobia bacterium]|nr:glucuronate isomerase [Verrucomicrobiota bacterium]